MGVEQGREEVLNLLSRERYEPYLEACGRNPERALKLYVWSTRMASASFEAVSHLEVFMRNSMDRALAEYFDKERKGIPWFLQSSRLLGDTARSTEAVRERLQQQHPDRDTRHQIVANLTFGFWSGLLGSKYEELWREALRFAYPNSTGARKDVSIPLESIRKFRNRIAHQDSMLNVDVPFELERIYAVARKISPACAQWIESLDRSQGVYSDRPDTGLDTVIVPGCGAWDLYAKHRAYVCEAGRRFRPVTRLAFYCERKVMDDVPMVLGRRDGVVWTRGETERLAASDDRVDRKIAALISSTLSSGGQGLRQVFIFSDPDDSRHRRLSGPVFHHGAGRGSAFVKRHRYASLHKLQVAVDTSGV